MIFEMLPTDSEKLRKARKTRDLKIEVFFRADVEIFPKIPDIFFCLLWEILN